MGENLRGPGVNLISSDGRRFRALYSDESRKFVHVATESALIVAAEYHRRSLLAGTIIDENTLREDVPSRICTQSFRNSIQVEPHDTMNVDLTWNVVGFGALPLTPNELYELDEPGPKGRSVWELLLEEDEYAP